MKRTRLLKSLIIIFAILLLILSLYSTFLEYSRENPARFVMADYFQNWLISIGPEAAGIALTILVIVNSY